MLDQIFNAKHGLNQDNSDQKQKETDQLTTLKKVKREDTIEDTQ